MGSRPVLAALLIGISFHAQGWESTTTSGAFRVPSIGLALEPSKLGNNGAGGFFVPRSANGKAYLDSFSLTVSSGETPPGTIYLHAAPPLVGDIVSGAFASASGFGSYTFDPPLELPFDAPTYVVFEQCVDINGSFTFSNGGQALRPSNNCPADSRAAQVVTNSFGLRYSAFFHNPEAPVTADYRFDVNLDSSINNATVGPLIDVENVNGFINDSVLGQSRTVLDVLSGSGLEGSLSNALSAPGYTIVLLLRLNQVDGGRKLIDFSGLSEDEGLYVQDQRLEFRGGGGSAQDLVKADTWQQIVITRQDDAPPASASVRGYVDGQSAFSFGDTTGMAQALKGNAFYLRDDGNENTGGAVARLRVYDGELLSGEVQRLTALPPEGADALEIDDTPLSADSGPNFGPLVTFRTLHDKTDVDWLFAGPRCYGPTWYTRLAGLQLFSEDPRFQPIVEVFGQNPPVGANPQPIASFGQCGQQSPLHFLPDGFIRISNCPDVGIDPADPVEYTVVPFRPDIEICGPVALVSGQVLDAATMAPVPGVFVVGNGVDTAVSGPGSAQYQLAATGGAMTLVPFSDQWFGDPVNVQTMPGQNLSGVDILVNRDLQPDAVNDSASVDEDQTLNASVAGNDDPGDAPATYSLNSGASNGSLNLLPDGSYSYDPAPDFNGPDSFSYRLTDNDGDMDTATVSLTVNPVNDPPVAANDLATVLQDSGSNTIAVLNNDTDPDGPGLSLVAVTQPPGGSVQIAADGLSLSYAPVPGTCNNGSPTDDFFYTVSDGELQDMAGVSVTVTCTGEIIFTDSFELP